MTETDRTDWSEPVHPDHEDFLRDESRVAGDAESIAFPLNEADVVNALREAARGGLPVTTQGGRTGITAGSVPRGGLILNLEKMNAITGLRVDPVSGRFLLRVQPGVLLGELRKAIHLKEFDTATWSTESLKALEQFRNADPRFFSPDPTETTASIGGMIACNASGALTFHYGPTRRHVEALRIGLPDGEVLELRRGEHGACGRSFELTTESGRVLRGELPGYAMPSVKNAAGYYAADDMDLVDLFIGAEGTLGVVLEAELALLPEPPVRWGVMCFLPDELSAITFVRLVRGDPVEQNLPVVTQKPAAVEFFDRHALDLLRRKRADYAVLEELPELPPDFHTAVYVEYHDPDEDTLMEALEVLIDIMDRCGGSEDATWTATEDHEMQRLRDFRHAVPETVNMLIDERRKEEPALTKLGTDMAVPDEKLETVMALYHETLGAAGLEYVVFGHIGNNHVHVNILPRSLDDYEKGKSLYLDWARRVIEMGGTVSAEHGIGKLKVPLLRAMYGDPGIEQMKAVKKVFDPGARLNRGNLFESE